MKRNFTHIRFIFIFLIILVSACSSPQLKNASEIEANAIQLAISKKTEIDTLKKAEKDLEIAISESKLNIYSPLHIEKATKNIQDSKNYKQSPPKDIKNASLMSAIAASIYIELAYKNKKLVETTLSEADKHLVHLQKINGAISVPNEYKSAIDMFKEAAVKIETGAVLEASENQHELVDKLVDVQIKALKKNLLGEALEQMSLIEELNGEKYIPDIYASAQNILNKALTLIETNFRDDKEIKALSNQARTRVSEAYFITSEANLISQLSDKELGGYLTHLFKELNESYDQLALEKNGPFNLQNLSEAILTSVKNTPNTSTNNLLVKDKPEVNTPLNASISESALSISKNSDDEEETVLPGFDNSSFVVETELKSDEESFDDEESFSSFN